MSRIEINSALFKFQYLPDYAKFLLDNKLEEFVTVGIRFCREMDLPMMRPLARIPEKQLIALSTQSNRELLTALSENNVAGLIERNITNYVNNQMNDPEGNRLLDRNEVVAEDIILGFYIRRKLFAFFLYAYTPNAVVHTLLMAEVDAYTTNEHLLTTKAYVATLKEEQPKL